MLHEGTRDRAPLLYQGDNHPLQAYLSDRIRPRAKPAYAGIFRGSILTILPSRSTAILFPARRCLSIAIATDVVSALLMIALFEKVWARLSLRDFFLFIDFSSFDEFIPGF